MTDLRTAAQQALEALEDWDSPVALPAMVALKAALAEDDGMYGARALAKAYENGWNAAKEHTCDTRCTWADHAVGCVRAEPVQEPVAWSHINGTSDTKWHPPQRPAESVQEPVWVCPDSAEHRYQKPGHCEDCGKTLVQETT